MAVEKPSAKSNPGYEVPNNQGYFMYLIAKSDNAPILTNQITKPFPRAK